MMLPIRLSLVAGLLVASALPGCSTGVSNDSMFETGGTSGSSDDDDDDGAGGTSSTSTGGKGGSAGKAGAAGKAGSTAGTSAGAGEGGEEGEGGEGGAGSAGSQAGHAAAGKGGSAGKGGASAGTAGTGSDVFGGGGISAAGKSGAAGMAGSGSTSCDGTLADNDCGHCVEATCCPETQACLGDDDCLACLNQEGPCTGSLVDALDSCATQKCDAACSDTGTGGATGDGGTCCEATYDYGCSNSTIEACVCAKDSYCCDTEWDEVCVDKVSSLGCSEACTGGSGSGSCTDGGSEYKGSTPCDTCFDTETDTGGCCASSYNACGNSSACVSLYNCVADCTSQTCADQCSQKYPGGVTTFNTFITCIYGDTGNGACGLACAE